MEIERVKGSKILLDLLRLIAFQIGNEVSLSELASQTGVGHFYFNVFSNYYFWRTWDSKEIDFVEEREGKLFGYEFKWKEKIVKQPKEWLANYQNSEFHIINSDNYLDFVM